MNPNVSRGEKRKAMAIPQPPQSSWFSSIIGATISPIVAMAFVFFAAGSVASMSVLAYSEISQGSEPSLVHSFAYLKHSQVLGDSTTSPVQAIIQDSQLEAGAITGKISAKPVNFDSTLGRWDYSVTYNLPKFNGTATLSVGSYVIAQGITSSGSTETGNILKPNKVYHITIWLSDQSGSLAGALRYELKTQKGKNSSSNSQDNNSNGQCANPIVPPQSDQPAQQGSSATSSPMMAPNFCIQKEDGTSQCAPIKCMPPMRRRMQYDMNKDGNKGDGKDNQMPPTGDSNSNPPPTRRDGSPQNQNASGTPSGMPLPPQNMPQQK